MLQYYLNYIYMYLELLAFLRPQNKIRKTATREAHVGDHAFEDGGQQVRADAAQKRARLIDVLKTLPIQTGASFAFVLTPTALQALFQILIRNTEQQQ